MSGLAGLLARRLCHDFAGPAGAIGTAVEMISDRPDAELVALAADSAAALIAALELYRYVLTPSPDAIGGGRARALVTAWLAGRDAVGLDWPDDDAAWLPGIAALTAGLAMIAADNAVRAVTLRVGAGVVAGVELPGDVAAALAGGPVTTTRAALAGALAEQAGLAGLAIRVDAATLRVGPA